MNLAPKPNSAVLARVYTTTPRFFRLFWPIPLLIVVCLSPDEMDNDRAILRGTGRNFFSSDGFNVTSSVSMQALTGSSVQIEAPAPEIERS